MWRNVRSGSADVGGESHSRGMFLYVRDVADKTQHRGLICCMWHYVCTKCVCVRFLFLLLFGGYGGCVCVCVLFGVCVCVYVKGNRNSRESVKSLPVALFRVVLQLHPDAANSLQQHGCTVVTIHDSGVNFDLDTDVLVGLAQQLHLLTQNSLLLRHVLARYLQTSLWCGCNISDPEVWTGYWRWTHILPQSRDLRQRERDFITVLRL